MVAIVLSLMIFNFQEPADVKAWFIVNDGVMGGRSQGNLTMDDNGNGVFYGTISLENNGGFSMISHRTDGIEISGQTTFHLRVKGDGSRYEFRVKSQPGDRHSYVYSFDTSGEWETIEIPLKEMEPTFRGMKLNMKNYPGKALNEVSILAGNKKQESFKILIDKIELK